MRNHIRPGTRVLGIIKLEIETNVGRFGVQIDFQKYGVVNVVIEAQLEFVVRQLERKRFSPARYARELG